MPDTCGELHDLLLCPICNDPVKEPVTLPCCGDSFCCSCLKRHLTNAAREAKVPLCPTSGCSAALSFRLPAKARSLHEIMQCLRAGAEASVKQLPEAHERCGDIGAWSSVIVSQDVYLEGHLVVRRGMTGLVICPGLSGEDWLVAFDHREDMLCTCVPVWQPVLSKPLPRGLHLDDCVMAVTDLCVSPEVVIPFGTRGLVVEGFSSERVIVLFDNGIDGLPGRLCVDVQSIEPVRPLAGGFWPGQQVQCSSALVAGSGEMAPQIVAGTSGIVVSAYNHVRLTVAFGSNSRLGGSKASKVWANVLPNDIHPWMPVLDNFPIGAKVQAAHHVSVPADVPGLYTIITDAAVSPRVSRLDPDIAELGVGSLVEIEEVLLCADDQRIRARIKDPAGWISLVDLEEDPEGGARWAHQLLVHSGTLGTVLCAIDDRSLYVDFCGSAYCPAIKVAVDSCLLQRTATAGA
mmetsp:Transcript_17064/g.30795  ORF Transcript_17064/g.30795 Transcript_17064/m.30795 type:complete len:461 (+) Transcript_17064:101-1483(+)